MTKRRLIVLGALTCAATAAFLASAAITTGPKYHGQSARAWARELTLQGGKLSDVIEALQALGPAAVPHLVKLSEHKQSAFDVVYRRLLDNLPAQIAGRLPAAKIDSAEIRTRAVDLLGKLGLSDPKLVEAVAAALADPEPQVRSTAAVALRRFNHADPDLAVTVLTLALNDPNLLVRQNAAASLGRLGSLAAPALPVLQRLAQNGDAELRPFALHALAQIDPAPVKRMPSSVILTTNSFHLGVAGRPEWDEFAGKTPHGPRLDVKFEANENHDEQTLFIRQQDVKHEWSVYINNRKLGTLQLGEVDLLNTLPIPPGTLIDGENTLSVLPPKQTDDILLSDIRVVPRNTGELLLEAQVSVTVTDLDGGRPVPCRLTIADESGALMPLQAIPGADQTLAVRPGVVYTGNGNARIGLQSGTYLLYASRGFEYSVSTQRVELAKGDVKSIQLAIRREVPTPGLVACDTHTHTLTYGGHGDATIDERILTLAGEGIELPIATEHNRLVDYSEPAQRLGLLEHFTPITGIEVTTRRGHFNVFPVRDGSTPPDAKIEHWPDLMREIRSTPGVEVIILNHPRDLHSNFRPFAETNFNPVTGQNLRGFEFEFNALEVINSGALQSDLMQLFRDWFALLNYGYKIAAAGASDSHDVNRFILGQGRTYVPADDRNPARIDVDEATRSFREGRTSASLGLLPIILVNERFSPGDLARPNGEFVSVDVKVLGPSWIDADHVALFANGTKIREQSIQRGGPSVSASAVKVATHWQIPRPAHDIFLVAIASGPGVTAPFWPIPKPYQPTTSTWEPRVIGSTGAVWIDADGDGEFTSARRYAQRLVEKHGITPGALIPALEPFDAAVAAQAAALAQAAGAPINGPAFREHLERAPAAVQHGFSESSRYVEN